MSDYTVVGGGAIGGTLAAYLARGGAAVTIIDTDAEHVDAINTGGLRIERATGGFTVAVSACTPQGHEGALGAVILAVKAQATAQAMEFIGPRLAEDGWVASVQNGLNEPLIAEKIGAGRTIASFVNIFADMVRPGVVRDGGLGALVFGEYGGGPSERTLRLAEDLREWGGRPLVSSHVEGYLWSKLSFGAMLAATAIADEDMHRLIDAHRPIMHGVAEDVLRVAVAKGIRPELFDAYDPRPYLPGGEEAVRDAATDRLVAWLSGQAKKRSGIWRDIAVRKRPTEMPAHYGPVIAEAERLGVPVPHLRAVLSELADVEQGGSMDESRLRALDERVKTMRPSIIDIVDSFAADMREDLIRYVEVETPSDDEESLRAGLAWVEAWLTSRLGRSDERIEVPAPGYGDHRVLEYRGTVPGLVAVLGHYDTVWPLGTLATWPVSIDGDRFSGPGAFDMKGGLVQFVWAIVAARQAGWDLPTIRIVLNGDEELGSISSRATIEHYTADADAVLVFEASSGGAVKTARKGVGLFTIEVTGVEAHAGLDPLAGASAIHELAALITRLSEAADLSVGTSVNVGVVEGGSRANVTAGHASACVDVRVDRASEMARVDALLASLTPHSDRASVIVTGGWNRPVMERKPGTARLFDLAKGIAAEHGWELQETSVGGASDGNFAAACGRDVLDGLGAVGGGAHARTEWISLAGMRQRAALTAQLLRELGGPGE